MERLTVKSGDRYTVSPDDMEKAMERLARFEDLAEGLAREQEEIARTLEELRVQGKEKTVQFKELLARKLVNNNLRMAMERYGLW